MEKKVLKPSSINHIFSTPYVVFNNIKVDHDSILKELQQQEYFHSWDKHLTRNDPVHQPLNESTHGNNLLDNLKNGKKLKKVLNEKISDAIKDYFQFNIKHTTINSWATRTKPNQQSQIHNHRNFWLSGSYYPHGNKNDKFKIEFFNPRTFHWDIPISINNEFNSTSWIQNIKKGDFIIFPSYLKHQIMRNVSPIPRYSIAINILPRGVIGAGDGELSLKC